MLNSGRTLAINYAENFAACCDWRCFTVSNCCCKSSLKYLINFLILINALKSSYPMKKGTPHFNTGVSSKGHSFSAPKAVSSTRQFSTNASVQYICVRSTPRKPPKGNKAKKRLCVELTLLFGTDAFQGL